MHHLSTDDLVTYLDGELPAHLRVRCDAHLSRCPACRRQADRLRATWDLLDDLPEPAIPAGAADRAIRTIAASTAPRGSDLVWAVMRRAFVPLAAAAVLALLVWTRPSVDHAAQTASSPRPIVLAQESTTTPQASPAEIERIMRDADLLETLHQYGDLIDHLDTVVELDRLLKDSQRAL